MGWEKETKKAFIFNLHSSAATIIIISTRTYLFFPTTFTIK